MSVRPSILATSNDVEDELISQYALAGDVVGPIERRHYRFRIGGGPLAPQGRKVRASLGWQKERDL